MENLVGRQFGPYRIVAPLGEGGMAAVYKAYQPNVDRYVALKVLPSYFAHDPQFVGRFRQEAKILAKLQHPHVLPVFDFGEEEGYTFIVMPLVEAGSLAGLLGQGLLPWSQIQRIIAQVGSALDYAHSKGTVHRDVKPSNVLIDQHNNCQLTDFGIAKMVESASALTQTGGTLGTPAYMSPEQIRGEPLDGRSDIYSLGIVLYEMVTGRPPFRAETPPAIFVKHLHDPLPPPHLYRPEIPVDVERVVLKALAKDREDRFQTAGAMAAALAQAIAAEPLALAHGIAAEPPTASVLGQPPIPLPDLPPAAKRMPSTEVMVPTKPTARPPRWLVPVVGALAVVIIALLLVFVVLPDRQRPAQTVESPPVADSQPTTASTLAPTDAPAVQPTSAQAIAAEPATPPPAEKSQTSIRARLDSSSDWAQAVFWFRSQAAHVVQHETIETGGQPIEAAMEDLTIYLEQEFEQAEVGETVYLVEEIVFKDLQADQHVVFSVRHGCLGQVVLEIQNMVTGSPVTIARLVSEGDEGCGSSPNNLGVAVADLLDTSPPLGLTPLPTEPPGRASYNQGLAHRDQEEYAEAIASFDEAAAMGWERAQLYVARAYTCREWYETSGECDLEQAVADWSRAIELEPDNPVHYADRGWTHYVLGQFDRCVASCAKAVELDPENAEHWHIRAICYRDMGDLQAALADHNRAIELGVTHRGMFTERAWTYKTLGEFDLAIADWTRAIEFEPEYPTPWYDRAWCYVDKGDNDAARSDFESFMQLTEGEAEWEDMRAEARQWLNSH